MAIGVDWFDEFNLVVAYLPADVRLRDIVEPHQAEGADPRFRQFNELIVIQDAHRFSKSDRGTRMAMEMSETYGADEGYKTAYIVKGAGDLGLVRIFNAYRGRHPDTVEVFLEIDPALEFLGLSDGDVRTDCYNRLAKHAEKFNETLWF